VGLQLAMAWARGRVRVGGVRVRVGGVRVRVGGVRGRGRERERERLGLDDGDEQGAAVGQFAAMAERQRVDA
jgi:hypothetical protein